MIYEQDYFHKFTFSESQKESYLASAEHSLKIAKDSNVPEVVFKFSYEALIKLGVYLIAKDGHRARSIPGHHFKIIEKMSQILKNREVFKIGNKIRERRNADLYDGCFFISEKDSKEILEFIEKVFNMPPYFNG
ncbi:MAG: hypothetical protein WC319_07935 [Candidatus Paceibacterota bacterium]